STDQSPSHTYEDAGSFTVRLIAPNTCGPDTLIKTDYITVDLPPAPVAVFSGSPTSGCLPLGVSFTDGSTGDITSWSWSFGDDSTSTDQSPSHTYEDAGSFTVTLIATNTCGPDTMIKTDYITVDLPPAPVAVFSGSPTSDCLPLEVSFTDGSTGDITSWSWDFGDDSTSVLQSPSHTYAAPGIYTVTLTVTGPGGSDDEIKTDYITVGDVVTASFAASDTSGPSPLTVDFTDLSTGDPDSWSWNFGDDSTSTDQSPSHIYVDAGSFTVTLIASNVCGQDTTTLDITVTTTTDAINVPLRFDLRQNYPNPFNPTTTIEFTLAGGNRTRLDIFDVTGRLMTTLIDREMSKGIHRIAWRADRYSSGVYFMRLTSGGNTAIRRLILLR
ncbi:PKD domain-containing protein, partial [bacterium]|nr:PKD domain-containing protein [bacterium]